MRQIEPPGFGFAALRWMPPGLAGGQGDGADGVLRGDGPGVPAMRARALRFADGSAMPRPGHDFSRIRVHSDAPSIGPRPEARALRTLLSSRLLQSKLSAGGTADPEEMEADRIADAVMQARSPGPAACTCNGSGTCPRCAARGLLSRPWVKAPVSGSKLVATPVGGARVQRQSADDAAAGQDTDTGSSGGLLVEDDAERVGAGQMRKGEYLDRLRTDICAATEPVLATIGQSTEGCPYLDRWFGYFAARSASQLEQTLRRYAPEAAATGSAADSIPVVVEHVRSAVATWASTGQVTGVPEGLSDSLGDAAQTAPSPAAGGAEAGGAEDASGDAAESVQAKRGDAGVPVAPEVQTIRRQLGPGTALHGATRRQMEQAFGFDFAPVRVHADATGARLSREINARAFTIGNDIAFAAGEYQPGTLLGDALIAHELAHVVQQSGNRAGGSVQTGGDAALESEADLAALQISLGTVPERIAPLGGLRLQRCTPAAGGEITGSAFNFEQITGRDDPNDRSLPWYAACVNITISFLGTGPRMQICQFEVGFPGIHRLGRTSIGEAQTLAAEAFNECVPMLIRRRNASCAEIAACVQRRMRASIPGVRVNFPCLTRALTPTDWPTRH